MGHIVKHEREIVAHDGRPSPDHPGRRLLIVPELAQFATDGTVTWTQELVDTFAAWSDFGNPESRICRMAFVSQTLTTDQIRSKGNSFSDALANWNEALPQDQQLELSIWYGNNASSHPGVGAGNDRVGHVHFFTREHFDKHRTMSWSASPVPDAGAWHHIFEQSLRSHHIVLHDVYRVPDPGHWLEVGQVRQSDPYRRIVMMSRSPESELDCQLFSVS